MTERRRLHADAANRYATEADARGVQLMRSDELNSVPSTVLITWDALRDVTLDLVRRLDERPQSAAFCRTCGGGPCQRTPPHEA